MSKTNLVGEFHGNTLSLEDIRNQWIIQNGICPYTGIKMELQTATSKCKNRLNLASLDRIDSSKQYSKDNIEFVVLPINYMKNQFKKEEIIEFLKIFQKINLENSK